MSRRLPLGGPIGPTIVALAVALVLGCSGGRPSPSPPAFQDVFEALARRGAAVTGIVSGDPACDRLDLVANAVRFTLTMSDGVPREIHLFAFRNQAGLESARSSLTYCTSSFRERLDRPNGSVGSVESGALYAFGAPFAPAVRDLLIGAFIEAAGGG
jgi:hypothetical protein